ncbi:MAG: methyltransferase domain-containing protein [Actinobacteria bacterium]|nr:methyltransferase domain-containing protein [Actinomycetota bacterium]
MDRTTIDVYDAAAPAYAEARPGAGAERLAAFSVAVPAGHLRLDLGCGPGLDLAGLGRPVVGLDASSPMLREAAQRVPWAPLVRADLTRLPVRAGALGGVWASKSLQHVAAGDLPMTLAGVHRAMVLGGPLHLALFAGEGTSRSDGDLPGRLFTLLSVEDARDLLTGAGFTVETLEVGGASRPGSFPSLVATATRARTLPDTVAPGMRLLVCGLNPSLYAADAGVGYARPGNRFWPAVLGAGLATRSHDADDLLARSHIGLTDLVKRATARAESLTAEEYAAGVARVERLCARLAPRAVCLVGLAGWRAAVDRRAQPGWQSRRLGPSPVYLMPSTSGLNGRSRPTDFVRHLQAAAAGPTG